MSILLASLLIAAGSAVASGWLVSRKKQNAKDASASGADANAQKPADKTAAPELAGFPCQLGDVILRRVGDEAWLEGCLVLSEDTPVAALFVAPEGKSFRGVYVRPRPTMDLYWLAPVSADTLMVGAEPPTSLEHEGLRYERSRRLPLRTKRVGVGAPDLGETAICAEYTGPGPERILVLSGDGTRSIWAGEALLEGMYDVLAGGKSTLE